MKLSVSLLCLALLLPLLAAASPAFQAVGLFGDLVVLVTVTDASNPKGDSLQALRRHDSLHLSLTRTPSHPKNSCAVTLQEAHLLLGDTNRNGPPRPGSTRPQEREPRHVSIPQDSRPLSPPHHSGTARLRGCVNTYQRKWKLEPPIVPVAFSRLILPGKYHGRPLHDRSWRQLPARGKLASGPFRYFATRCPFTGTSFL